MNAMICAVRTSVGEAKRGTILGLMPEGTVGSTPELMNARQGAGLFLLLLATTGVRMLPVGLYEEGGRLVASFGDPFALPAATGVPREARDAWARDRVMTSIKDLLPVPLWGAYADKG